VTDKDKEAVPTEKEVLRRYWSDFNVDIARRFPDLDGRRQVERAAEVLHQRDRPIQPVARAISPPTAYAVVVIHRLPAAVSKLRRNHSRITYTSVARELEIDRDSLSDWIRRGWIDWPPA
jgi:hypothetical protein